MRCLIRFGARLHRAGRAVLVADFPVEDVVRLALAVRPQQHLVGLRGERIGDDGQRRVVDLHRFGAVDGRRARLGEHGGDFLILEEHLADREHHLLVEPVKGRQPPEPGGLEVLAGDHGLDAGHLHRLADVDVLDLGVRVGAPHQREVEHARKREVVDVVPFALDEARILLALHRHADRVQRLRLNAHRRSLVSVVTWWRRPAGRARRPPAAPPSRCSGSRCTGTGCRRAPRECRPRSDVGWCFSSAYDVEQHAGRAVAALQAMLIPEALLQRVQRAAFREPFDGEDLVAVGLHREHRAGLHRPRRRPSRRRSSRSSTCRSRRACRSARTLRAGSTRAACAARRPARS